MPQKILPGSDFTYMGHSQKLTKYVPIQDSYFGKVTLNIFA